MQIRSVQTSWTFRFARAALAVALVAVVAAVAQAKPGRGPGPCRGKKVACTTDVTAPGIAIATPVDGTTVAPGLMSVGGTAVDETGVVRVEVTVGGLTVLANISAEYWNAVVDLSAFAAGPYVLEARARDAAGNIGESVVTLNVAVPIPSPSPSESTEPGPIPTPTSSTEPLPEPTPDPVLGLGHEILSNPVLSEDLVLLGRGRLATDGSRTLMLYQTRYSKERWMVVRDAVSGARAHVRLPSDGGSWAYPSSVLHGRDLWVLAGVGPVVVRHYRFDQAGLPGGVELVSSRTLGDQDSFPGELIRLDSGALVAQWHQLGRLGPQGHRVAYLAAGATSWQVRGITYMPTLASRHVVAQHPADGSVWVFSNADAWGDIGAMRLVESGGSLVVSSTDAHFIDDRYAEFDADPERPSLAVTTDALRDELVLVYQTATRRRFSSSVIGSYPAVARIDASGMKSFRHVPFWVERVSDLALAVRGSETWVAFRRIDAATLRFDTASIARLLDGAWVTEEVGRLWQPYDPLFYTSTGVVFAASLGDGRVHLYG